MTWCGCTVMRDCHGIIEFISFNVNLNPWKGIVVGFQNMFMFLRTLWLTEGEYTWTGFVWGDPERPTWTDVFWVMSIRGIVDCGCIFNPIQMPSIYLWSWLQYICVGNLGAVAGDLCDWWSHKLIKCGKAVTLIGRWSQPVLDELSPFTPSADWRSWVLKKINTLEPGGKYFQPLTRECILTRPR